MHTETSEGSRWIGVGSKNIFQSRTRQGKHPDIPMTVSSGITSYPRRDDRRYLVRFAQNNFREGYKFLSADIMLP